MALTGVIASFATGTYTVTRTVQGSYTAGRFVNGSASTFTIEAVITPLSGRNLKTLAEGQHTEDTRQIRTVTELRTRTPASEPDVITIDGEPWEIFRVSRWQAFGGDGSGNHWHAFAARQVIP